MTRCLRGRFYDLASRATGKQRLDYLARHTTAVWLWTLAQRRGTPCVPLIVRWQCTAAGGHCGGIGDRIKGIQVGFWLVRMASSALPQPSSSFDVCMCRSVADKPVVCKHSLSSAAQG